MTRGSNRMTRGEFAKFCDVSPATVTNWMDAGMPAERSGRKGAEVAIDIAAAIPWVINYREPPGSQRERLAKEQADKIAMQNETQRGRLIDVAIVEEIWMAKAAHMAQLHDAVAGRLAHEFLGSTDPGINRSRLLAELREVRDSIAKFTLGIADALERAAESGEHREAAAEPDGEPVGGSDKTPSGRKRRTRKVAK